LKKTKNQNFVLLFSNFYSGIKLEERDIENGVPEKVMNYIASRILNDQSIILDASCRSGAALIRLA
jgi:hypothetical protein